MVSWRLETAHDWTMMGNNSRRKILQAIGSGSIVSVTPTNLSTKLNRKKEREFVGVSYDTFTHQSQGEATASLEITENRIKGLLNVGGFEIPVNVTNDGLAKGGTIGSLLDSGEYMNNGLPLKLLMNDHGNSLTGYLTRQGPKFGKLGFTLGEVQDDVSVQFIESLLIGGGAGAPDRPRKRVGASGVPRQSETTESEVDYVL